MFSSNLPVLHYPNQDAALERSFKTTPSLKHLDTKMDSIQPYFLPQGYSLQLGILQCHSANVQKQRLFPALRM